MYVDAGIVANQSLEHGEGDHVRARVDAQARSCCNCIDQMSSLLQEKCWMGPSFISVTPQNWILCTGDVLYYQIRFLPSSYRNARFLGKAWLGPAGFDSELVGFSVLL
jgi:hypothetical protein